MSKNNRHFKKGMKRFWRRREDGSLEFLNLQPGEELPVDDILVPWVEGTPQGRHYHRIFSDGTIERTRIMKGEPDIEGTGVPKWKRGLGPCSETRREKQKKAMDVYWTRVRLALDRLAEQEDL